MTYIVKPKNHHPLLEKNKLGLTRRDYEGAVSTLCAGCGHDSVSSAIVEACFQLSIESYKVATFWYWMLFKSSCLFLKSIAWI
jgi:2-oxoglutarate ferredoxin oxidoreductase subunit beta